MAAKNVILNGNDGEPIYPRSRQDGDGRSFKYDYLHTTDDYIVDANIDTTGKLVIQKSTTEEIVYDGSVTQYRLSLNEDFISIGCDSEVRSAEFPEGYQIIVTAYSGNNKTKITKIITDASEVETGVSLLYEVDSTKITGVSPVLQADGTVLIEPETLNALEGKIKFVLYYTIAGATSVVANCAFTGILNEKGEPGSYTTLKSGSQTIHKNADGEYDFKDFDMTVYKYTQSIAETTLVACYWKMIINNGAETAEKYLCSDGWQDSIVGKTPSCVSSITIGKALFTSYSNLVSFKVECYSDATFATADLVDREVIECIQDGSNGTDGESAYVIHIDNEFVSIPCTSDGTVIDGYDWSNTEHTVTATYGTETLSFKVATALTPEDKYTIIYTVNNVTYVPGTTGTAINTYTASISGISADSGTVTYDLYYYSTKVASSTFTAVKNKQGESAGRIWIITSANSIKIDKNNVRTPSDENITFNFKQQIGTEAVTDYEGYYRYSIDEGTWVTGTSTSVDVPNTAQKNITVELYDKDDTSTLYDTETVSVVIDGEDGEDGEDGKDGTSSYYLDIANSFDSVPCDSSGIPVEGYDWEGQTKHPITAYAGTEKLTYTLSNLTPTAITTPATYTVVYVLDSAIPSGYYIPGSAVDKVYSPYITGITNDSENGKIKYILYENNVIKANSEFAIDKQKAGANGETPVDHYILTDCSVIKKDKSGSYTPTAETGVTFSFYSRTGAQDPESYSGYFTCAIDGVITVEAGTGSSYKISGETFTSITKNAVITLYGDAEHTIKYDTATVILVQDGSDGAGGKGIAEIINYYQATETETAPEKGGDKWETEVSKTGYGATKQYLWSYNKTIYSDETSTTTGVLLAGRYSKDGKGISEIDEKYIVTSTSTTPTAEGVAWTTFEEAKKGFNSTNKYFWNKETITYDQDGTSKILIILTAVYGDKGETGATGNGISTVVNYYKATVEEVTPSQSESGWETLISATGYGKDIPHLWSFNQTTFTDTTIKNTDVVLTAKYAKDGVGISTINETYATTQNSTTPTESSVTWTDFETAKQQFSSTNRYLWNKEVTTYTDTTTKTNIILLAVYGEKGDKGDAWTGTILVTQVIYTATDSYGTPAVPTAPVLDDSGTWKISKITCGASNKFIYTCTQTYKVDQDGTYVAASVTFTKPELIEAYKNDGVDVVEYATFMKLTKGGAQQGLYYGGTNESDLYINATYIKSGTMEADRILGGTLRLGVTSSPIEGSLKIYDSSQALIGSWDKEGISITQGSINLGDGIFTVDNDGKVTARNLTITGGSIAVGSNFNVTNTGVLTASGATISGKITATSGKIGGWTVTSNTIQDSDGDTVLNSNGKITCKNLIANTAGSIGNFTITSNALYNGKASLESADNGVYIGLDGISIGTGTYRDSSVTEFSGPAFMVKKNGIVNKINLGASHVDSGVLTRSGYISFEYTGSDGYSGSVFELAGEGVTERYWSGGTTWNKTVTWSSIMYGGGVFG